MNLSYLTSQISSFPFCDLSVLSKRDEDSTNRLQLITGIAVGALTLIAAGVLYCKRKWDPLRSLNYNNIRLTDLPGISHNPQLKNLDLSFKQLRNLPNIANYPLLEKLNLNNNFLINPPDLSNTPQLKQLHLNRNDLTNSPDVSKNLLLRELHLSKNKLTVAPNVSTNSQLNELTLSSNPLINPPDVSKNLQLNWLDLSYTQLTVAPNVSTNSQLTELNLDHNYLTNPPDVSNNPRLTYLNLSYNQLTEIPDSYLSLRSSLEINLENNRFSAEYLTAFQARLQAHRAAHPDQGPSFRFSVYESVQNQTALPLDDQLNSWVAEFNACLPQEQPAVDFFSLLSESDEVKQTLSRYLSRLRDIKDYKAGGEDRKNVIRRVYEMIKLASEKTEFKKDMLALVHEGTETCGDRVLIVFNDLEILAQFHQNLSSDEYKALAIRASRYEELKKYAKTICRDHRLGDEIETILYFQLKLKEALNLPISTNKMLYPGMSGVTDEMLGVAEATMLALSDEELLAKSDYWQTQMEQEHPEAVQEIKDHYSILSEQLLEYDHSEEKAIFLAEHPDLKNFLDRATAKGVVIEYNSLARFCSEERALKIASIDGV
jgi:hypothetical protein